MCGSARSGVAETNRARLRRVLRTRYACGPRLSYAHPAGGLALLRISSTMACAVTRFARHQILWIEGRMVSIRAQNVRTSGFLIRVRSEVQLLDGPLDRNADPATAWAGAGFCSWGAEGAPGVHRCVRRVAPRIERLDQRCTRHHYRCAGAQTVAEGSSTGALLASLQICHDMA